MLTYSKNKIRMFLSGIAFRLHLDRLGLLLADCRLNGIPAWSNGAVTRVVDPDDPDQLYLAIRVLSIEHPDESQDPLDVN